MKVLEQVKTKGVKSVDREQLPELCAEIREFFINSILEHGGHFSANLGVVELTVALHYVFDFSSDKLVWDVGHQAYIHKLLSGRVDSFHTIRKKDGLSGFPKLEESAMDHFGTGHSSTSISAAMGMAQAALLNDIQRQHIAVIGDGSLTGGMAFEALNNLGVSASNVLVVVNDNQMGIDPNLGAVNQHLEQIETAKQNLFENLNLEYSGPLDGHDVLSLVQLFEEHKELNYPRVIHLKTQKGKGYGPAEEEQTKWHSVKYVKIKPETKDDPLPRLQDVFGSCLLKLAESDERVVGITPAMPSGSSMNRMMERFADRVFDVGIAEQHAVTFAAGLALEGKRPFCHIYSSFAQRAYDQIIHDVALQNIPVILCLDRAGLVGEDGPTHHGVFDLVSLLPIPNLTILSPMDEFELERAMHWSIDHLKGPVVIRYPKTRGSGVDHVQGQGSFLKARQLNAGNKLAVLTVGVMGVQVQNALSNSSESEITHIDLRTVKPLDTEVIEQVLQQFDKVVCIEDAAMDGGVGMRIAQIAEHISYSGKLILRGIPDHFVGHGTLEELWEDVGLDVESIHQLLQQELKAN